jgi:hypothetical protein
VLLPLPQRRRCLACDCDGVPAGLACTAGLGTARAGRADVRARVLIACGAGQGLFISPLCFRLQARLTCPNVRGGAAGVLPPGPAGGRG